ncbi:MAG: DUF2752 domain-containing protein [Rhodothermales bacterium]|nr:DUF2752 domain-containing protein [Rhodothermales bacterium]
MFTLKNSGEIVFWIVALVTLACTDPAAPPTLDLCLFKWIGLECPGCGMGHALASLLHGDVVAAIDTHPLSPFALLAISSRVVRIWPRNPATGSNRLI